MAICPLIDQHTISEAINYIYQKPLKLDDSNCKCGECNPPGNHSYQSYGKFRCTVNLGTYWKTFANQIWTYNPDNKYELQFNVNAGITNFTQSQCLKSGVYVFSILTYSITSNYNAAVYSTISLSVSNNQIQCLYIPIKANDLVVMLVYNSDICFKVTDRAQKVSVYNATGTGPFKVDLISIGTSNFSGKMLIRVW